MKNLIKSLVREVAKLATRAVFLFLVLPVLYCLEPFRKFRFSLLYTRRIGHLAGNTDLFLRKRQINGTDPKTVYVFAGINPANRQLLEMFKRHLPIYENRWLTRFLFYIRPILERTRFWENLRWIEPHYDIFNRGVATLTFTEEEEERGRAFLSEIGIGEDDWFVCMHDRDPAYLDAHIPKESDLWRTRDFRNCRIENYLKAAEYITSKGGYVFRMGAIVDHALPDTGNPRIIDYAANHRGDFLDIYLPAKCRFFLGSDSGLFVISTIFDVPVALANCIFIGLNPFRRDDLFILKLLREKKSGDFLTFDEALKIGFYDTCSKHPEALGFEILENTDDEILDLAREMIDRLENRDTEPEGRRVSEAYRDQYLSEMADYEQAGNLCPNFALKHRHLIEAGAVMPGSLDASSRTNTKDADPISPRCSTR